MKRLIVLIGVVGISASAVLVRWSTAPSMVLVLYRMLIATAMMAIPTLLKGREELKSMTKKELLLTMAAGCCLGLHFSAFFESLRHTSIASAVILSDAEVLFVALGTIFVFHKKLSGKCWLAVGLSFVGAVMVALADVGGESGLLGNALALGSTLLLAMYTMIGASVRSRISNSTYTFVAYGCAALTVLVISLISGTPLTGYGANNWLTALGRRQIRKRKPVHQHAYPTIQQSLAEPIRPLRILQQRKRCFTGAGYILFHRRRRQHGIYINIL